MNRREFLKSLLTVAALSPLSNVYAKEGADGNKISEIAEGIQITRRQYKNTSQSLPLLGFGLMRLPRVSPDKPEIDYTIGKQMVDRAMKAGLNYFDTAYFYHNGLSEKFVGDVISANYPRESFYLASKMPPTAKTEEDLPRIFNEQLAKCKTDYFDFYLMHNMNDESWANAKNVKMYEFLLKMKQEGKIRRLGFSFHSTPELLQEIVDAHPNGYDFAQIQLNYFDWEMYKSKQQYEILTKAGIPVVVMEPLRGGNLASLNPEATKILKGAKPNSSNAEWAFRFVGSLPNVLVILSGMTLPEHLENNIATFAPFSPLSDKEREVLDQALAAYRKSMAIPCTACQYCLPCPFGVQIPNLFASYNQYKVSGNKWALSLTYKEMGKGNASSCVACGLCKTKCPQHLDIPELLKEVAKAAS